MLKPFLAGAGYLLRGLRLVIEPGLRRYVALPLLINALVFAGLLWLAADQFGALVDAILPALPQWLAWLAGVLWLLFFVAVAVLVFFTFSVVANLIAAPFNDLLAEAVERRLSGRGPPGGGGLWQAVKGAPGAMLDELRKLGYFIRWALPLLILFLIPGVNLLAPLAWAMFTAWMLALEYADYPMGNHDLRPDHQRRILGRQRWLSLGFGTGVMLATLIPLANFLVMPAAVAGASALWVDRLRQEAAT
ncbi:CysZ protein [Ectothiorhodospira mobilis]|uniref:Sulfate transporter CysZ n=1 Tax=Ectothiorhodospira mobilis TaxID=195064 RepID=A0A1I4PC64_ECTMO|nr:sulfate transporter CysZ [Ectothiorhodospira mobilis]SFM25197.1 CysZ protein [Ectothiorhodospira mobilis]